ncbi:(2Fe-2S)-binding protein [Thalassotalea litorea]|uniref:(2Fe-2S)-binding protein n=1 Tax=Thalassotalea litorea TaxID=2020715 RepID=A0A5R9IVD1_9GAMM|nr:(2Fe-2S)-binding protein [Thalassotalea litorea]TLU67126.1 (2Fe-2S)-binding protein [Thalassotalea litorea]
MIKFTINDKAVSSNAAEDTPLLWVIRDELKLKGTKFGCGIAQCGACTVHLNGAAVRSCSIPLSAAEGGNLTTIEGLNGEHPLQQAWLEAQVPQCGYCQSGQIMQAASLLKENPTPTEQEVIDVMKGNLCRCMSYTRITKAIMSVSQKNAVQMFDPAEENSAPSAVAQGRES